MHMVRRRVHARLIIKSLLVCAALFICANVISFLYYVHRTYPNTRLANQDFGSIPFNQLPARLSQASVLPQSVQLTQDKNSTALSTAELGISLDAIKTSQEIKRRHWLPVLNLISPPTDLLALTVDSTKLQAQLTKLNKTYTLPPVAAHIALQDGTFSIVNEIAGHQIDLATAPGKVIANIASGITTINLPATPIEAKVKSTALTTELQTIKSQQTVAISYTYQGKTRTPTTQDISNWYVPSGNSYTPSNSAIQSYLIRFGVSLGIKIKNISEAVQATIAALKNFKSLHFGLTKVPDAVVRKSYTYCVATRGVNASYLPELESKLRDVYSDSRGWSLDGQVKLTEGKSGCKLTVWLSAANKMTSFGSSICDSSWSCTVYPNVILNFDRWRYGSTAWNNSHGSLDDYRTMVINHETGHWFGFGHRHCSAAGQLAPVMQQQSINLEGCKFNPWPLAYERAALRTTLGL